MLQVLDVQSGLGLVGLADVGLVVVQLGLETVNRRDVLFGCEIFEQQVTERRVGAELVEAPLLVGQHEKQDTPVPQQAANHRQPPNGAIDVLEDVVCDYRVDVSFTTSG